jgi:hypothetical protein
MPWRFSLGVLLPWRLIGWAVYWLGSLLFRRFMGWAVDSGWVVYYWLDD